jgi:hypothetical protein
MLQSGALLATAQPTDPLAKRYNETCFLTAHSAYANAQDGWTKYRQQHLSLPKQLDFGVRGFMLATHVYHNEVKMCHGKCSGFYGFQRDIGSGIKTLFGADPGYQPFLNAMHTITSWMNKPENQTQVVTIFLQNYVDDERINALLRDPEIASLLFTPQDKMDDEWPILQAMVGANKRLVVFNEKKAGERLPDGERLLFFYLWEHVVESRYGTVRTHKVCTQRAESKSCHVPKEKRSLYLLNHFSYPSFSHKGLSNNHYASLTTTIRACNQSSELCPNKKPNFIALDFVDIGDGLNVVQELNGKHPLFDSP